MKLYLKITEIGAVLCDSLISITILTYLTQTFNLNSFFSNFLKYRSTLLLSGGKTFVDGSTLWVKLSKQSATWKQYWPPKSIGQGGCTTRGNFELKETQVTAEPRRILNRQVIVKLTTIHQNNARSVIFKLHINCQHFNS